MDKNNLLETIRDKNMDVSYFAHNVIKDDNLRNEIVGQLLSNNDIMVYYHCYYIVSMASELEAELFYPFWDAFALLLHHENSYHRNIGLTIIANLVSCDRDYLMDSLLKDYLKHIDDDKFMTSQCCVKNLKKIVSFRKDLREQIIEVLLSIEEKCSYPVKQIELLKFDILEILDLAYEESARKDKINEFILQASESISGKTKKKAKQLRKKYGI